jgi:putative ABC transport system permease protein
MKPIPPNRPLHFLRWFCREDYLEEIEGDLTEVFEKQFENSPRQAKWKFAWSVMKYFRPAFMKSFRNYQPNAYGMYKSYFKIGWRNLLKEKGYSFINIGGLAVGMAVAFLIGLWIYDELSFNKNHQNYNHIARIMERQIENGEINTSMNMPIPLSSELRSSFSNDFEFIVLSTPLSEHVLSSGDKQFTESGNYMESDAANLLTLEMIHGTRAGLDGFNSILISESLAEKLFRQADPVNQSIKIDNKLDVKVTGVYTDLPVNSEFQNVMFIAPWSLFLSSEEWFKEQQDDWTSNFFQVYVQIPEHRNFEEVSSKIKNTKLLHLDSAEASTKPALFLHPMSKWHLHSTFENGVMVISEAMKFVWFYGIIGVFVLLLACINFMNLSTARSEKRSKEIGIRKSIGSVRNELVTQFLIESLLTVMIAFILTVILIKLSLPWFNQITDKNLSVLWTNPFFWIAGITFVLITALIAGSYPAFYLSSFRPIKSLKGAFIGGRFAVVPRKVLVVFQFVISVSLIIGTITVYRQIQFSKSRPVGYQRDLLLYIDMKSDDIHNHFDAVRNDLLKSRFVAEIAESNIPVTRIYSGNSGFDWNGKKSEGQDNLALTQVSHGFGKTIGWEITNGRDFSKEITTDSTGVIINESAARLMGFENPVGETIQRRGKDYRILGVIKDMVMQSPYTPTIPTIFSILTFRGGVVSVKMNATTSMSESISKIEKVFKTYSPSTPFDYKFADDEYAKKFANEERIGKLAYVFAVLAIIISCLGLFGLASFMAEQRTKEIGIRKVLGASVANLWRMLSTDFVVLVLLSCLIAIPISYYFLSDWLKSYDYRTEISWWIFLVTGIGALGITLLTVSFQAVKAALMNPVNSLKSE